MKGGPLKLYVDGASRGNPGRAGIGVCIKAEDGETRAALSRYLGRKTNNEAEYWALLLGLREARRLEGDIVRIFTDSQLMERQIKGLYRVKDPKLKLLYKAVTERLKEFSSYSMESIPREQNKEADRLANQAIDRRIEREKERGGGEEEGMVAPR